MFCRLGGKRNSIRVPAVANLDLGGVFGGLGQASHGEAVSVGDRVIGDERLFDHADVVVVPQHVGVARKVSKFARPYCVMLWVCDDFCILSAWVFFLDLMKGTATGLPLTSFTWLQEAILVSWKNW